jgi:hypothetical protein
MITRNWFRRTCKESKITLYYWLHTMIIMQFTGLLSVHFSSFYFAFLFLKNPLVLLAMKTRQINAPKQPAEITCQNNPPEKSAMATCWIHPRLKPAEFTRRKDPPFQLAACLPEIPPSLLKIPRQDPARHPSPPPPRQLRQRSKGEGAGSRLAHPRILSRYFYFHSLFHEWLHILI